MATEPEVFGYSDEAGPLRPDIRQAFTELAMIVQYSDPTLHLHDQELFDRMSAKSQGTASVFRYIPYRNDLQGFFDTAEDTGIVTYDFLNDNFKVDKFGLRLMADFFDKWHGFDV